MTEDTTTKIKDHVSRIIVKQLPSDVEQRLNKHRARFTPDTTIGQLVLVSNSSEASYSARRLPFQIKLLHQL